MVKNLLETIRIIRSFQHVSQQNIADFLEITQSSYAKIERGESKLTVETFVRICCYLSIDISALFLEMESGNSINFRVLLKKKTSPDDSMSPSLQLLNEFDSDIDLRFKNPLHKKSVVIHNYNTSNLANTNLQFGDSSIT